MLNTKNYPFTKEEKSIIEKINKAYDMDNLDKFNLYYELLISGNEKINLTAITDKEGVLYKHFLDSIALSKYCDLSGKKLIDVGTGAGFPGLPLAIMNSDCDVTLLDSLNKRVNFLKLVAEELNLSNVNCFHGRAEDYGFNPSFREKFDIVTSRAVANLSTLSEYCIPFVKTGGYFIPYKSLQSANKKRNKSERHRNDQTERRRKPSR